MYVCMYVCMYVYFLYIVYFKSVYLYNYFNIFVRHVNDIFEEFK